MADALLWTRWCAHVGARLDAAGRAADAVALCAAGRAGSFALQTKLRSLDRADVDLDHPDLNVNVGLSRTFVASGRDAENADDGNGHGTRVAGTMAAIDNGVGVLLMWKSGG